MTIRRSTPTKHAAAAALALGSLLASTAAFAASGGSTPPPTTNVPPPDLPPGITTIDTTDYDAECEGKAPQSISGHLTITTPVQLEDHRCVKHVSGNLTIETDNEHRGFVLPWLTQVGGDLVLDGNANLDRGRFPRLWNVGDDLVVDAFNGAGTAWEAPKLTDHDGRFEVDAGTQTDLTGFDNLEDIGTLDIYLPAVNYPINPQMGYLEGLAGLESVGKLLIDTHAEQTSQSGDFLSSLIEVRGKAEIHTLYWLVGTDAIETIGSSLDIEVESGTGTASADGLESLREIGGSFTWDDTMLTNIDALSNLETVGGHLELPLQVSSLAGFASLESVGGDFTLEGPIYVSNLYALSNLQTVGGEFEVSNSGIGSLFGLENVSYLGRLRVQNNGGLINVAALSGAYVPTGGSVVVANNSPLTTCQANGLIGAMNLASGVSTSVYGNQNCVIWTAVPKGTFSLIRR